MKRFLSCVFAFTMALSLVILPSVSVVQAEGTDDLKNLYVSDNEFDFETWHTKAMDAYKSFKILLYSKKDFPDWKQAMFNADVTRQTAKKVYLNNVGNASEEEWDSMPQVEIIDYFTTYLSYVLLRDRDTDYYNSIFNNGDLAKTNYFENSVGLCTWTGDGCEELKSVYMTLADLQMEYYNYYSFPYNFHNDKSYAEEMGMSGAEDATETKETEEIKVPEEIKEFTKDEIEEIQNAIAETSAHNEAGNSKDANESPSYWWIALIVLAIIGAVVVVIKVKSDNKKEH